MTLGELRTFFENIDSETTLKFSLSQPFSWRGVYAECAFSIEETESTVQHNLDMIQQALTEEFEGWKGGDFRYDGDTKVNFEHSPGMYSAGDYITGIALNHLFK